MDQEHINFYLKDEEYGWLSNFYPTLIYYNGNNFPSAEHLYQALKTDNAEIQWWISRAPKPYLAYKAGRSLRSSDGFNEKRWEGDKVAVMHDVIKLKFLQNKTLRAKLLNTGNAILHEASPTDVFWGVAGRDMLGKLLMLVREELRDEYPFEPE